MGVDHKKIGVQASVPWGGGAGGALLRRRDLSQSGSEAMLRRWPGKRGEGKKWPEGGGDRR